MPMTMASHGAVARCGSSPRTLTCLLVLFIALAALASLAWHYHVELQQQQRLLQSAARQQWQALESAGQLRADDDAAAARLRDELASALRRFDAGAASPAPVLMQVLSEDGRVRAQWPTDYPFAGRPALVVEYPQAPGSARVRIERPVWEALAVWRAALVLHLALAAALAIGVLALSRQAQRRQAAIAARERFIVTVTDHLPGMVGYWDSALTCRFASRAYSEWFGKPTPEIVGLTMAELLGPDLWQVTEAHARAALAGERQEFVREQRKADGSLAQLWVQYIPDQLDAAVQGFYALASDVSPLKIAEQGLLDRNTELAGEIERRKRVEQSLRQHEAFLAAVLDGIDAQVAVIDGDGQIRMVNAAWERHARESGVTRMGAVGVGANYLAVCALAYGLPDAPQAGDVLLGLRALLAGQRDEYQCEYPAHSPGTQRWFRLHAQRLPGDSAGAVIVHRDISAYKRAEPGR